MTLSRRQFLKTGSLLAGAAFFPLARAAAYPVKPIRFMVPASPGTTLDALARFMSEPFAAALKTTVMVENRPGAGLLLGTQAAANAPADGYTLLFTGSAHYAAKDLSDTPLSFDPVNDFTPVARMSRVGLGLVVAADSPFKTLEDLLNAMRERPGELTYSSSGIGSTAHLCTVALNDATGTRARHVAYRGNGPAVIDVASGLVDFTCQGPGVIIGMLKAGTLRMLAVSSERRWPSAPEVPTVRESAVPDFEMSSWSGVLARAATPPEILQRLSDEFIRAGQTSQFDAWCAAQAAERELVGYQQFVTEVAAEHDYWSRLAQLAKREPQA